MKQTELQGLRKLLKNNFLQLLKKTPTKSMSKRIVAPAKNTIK